MCALLGYTKCNTVCACMELIARYLALWQVHIYIYIYIYMYREREIMCAPLGYTNWA